MHINFNEQEYIIINVHFKCCGDGILEDDYWDEVKDQSDRFRGGGEWSLEITVPQAILDLLPEWEAEHWWGVPVVIDDDGEGICENEEEACEEYGVKDVDDINDLSSVVFIINCL